MNLDSDIVIVGAGAAGLWAAAVCARSGKSTLLLEKTQRTGTKILASGGSRCNLTTTLNGRDAAQLFGPEAARFLKPAFRALSPSALRERFDAIGVPTKIETQYEKVFPKSDSAKKVRDALQRDAKQAGATIRLNCRVRGVERAEDHWEVNLGNSVVRSRAVLLCTGGKSFPRTGTTGDAYDWLRSLSLEVVPPVPALVPLRTSAKWVKNLSGIAIDSEVRIGKYRRRRPVLFTHTGLSGPGPMDASVHLTRETRSVDLLIDLLPDLSWEDLRADLLAGASAKGAPRLAKRIPLPKRVVEAVVRRVGLTDSNPRLVDLSRSERNKLVDTFKGLPVPIVGTMGFDAAEVTAGGLALSEVDHKTMGVKKCQDLYVFGELLDLTGPIGGLNFQAAFATAELAALAAIR